MHGMELIYGKLFPIIGAQLLTSDIYPGEHALNAVWASTIGQKGHCNITFPIAGQMRHIPVRRRASLFLYPSQCNGPPELIASVP